MSKSGKRSLKKRKRGGPEAKTVKEQKPLFHSVWEFFSPFFLKLRELAGRMLGRVGSREKKKEPSVSRERPDVASSSSALAAPSVAAKRASEEQTEGPAVQILSCGTVNGKDPCDGPNSTRNSIEASKPDPEVLEAEFSRNGVMVGGIVRVDRVGYHKNQEAEVNLVGRLPETPIEDDEVKCERPGSDSGDYPKNRSYDLKKKYDDREKYYDLKKKYDDLKEEREVFYKTVLLRQVFSDFRKTQSGKDMDDGIKKEVLKLGAAKIGQISSIIAKVPFTRIVFLMLFQRANMTLKSSFQSSDWRKRHRFPRFSDNDAKYQWWMENFDPVILEERLKIFREAAKNWDPELDMFRIVELVSDLNLSLHPQPSENELHEEDLEKMSRLQTTICYPRSGGDSKI